MKIATKELAWVSLGYSNIQLSFIEVEERYKGEQDIDELLLLGTSFVDRKGCGTTWSYYSLSTFS